MAKFDLQSQFKPQGDQPQAISRLVEGLERDSRLQTLLGVTGSGKTFTIANVIARHGRPTLVISHNKTLAAQLYEELKELVLVGASSTEIKREAVRLGMLTLRQSGINKLKEGITTVEEVVRCSVKD